MRLDRAQAEAAVRARHSVRTFTGQPLAPEILSALTEALGRPPLPAKAPGFGTYGMIRGAACFLPVVADGPTEDDACRAAARAERTVLWLTAQGVATCWLGATFHGLEASQGSPRVLALIAAGIAAAKAHLLSRISRSLARSQTRRLFGDLFDVAPGSPFVQALELVRLAPSAMNRQPWRAIQQGHTLHLYCESKDAYRTLDMGIAMAHFEIAAPEGAWLCAEAPAPPAGTTYFLSYRCKDFPAPTTQQ